MVKRSRSSSPPGYDEITAGKSEHPHKKPALNADVNVNTSRPTPAPTPPPDTGAGCTIPDATNANLGGGEDAPAFSYTDMNGCVKPCFDFDNGVVVLKTQSHPPSLFRASRAILAKESPIFRDMLTPENLAGYELYDGHPLLTVEDDPEDLQRFLSAVHHPREFHTSHDWTYLVSRFSILRTSTTYGVTDLRKRVIRTLSMLDVPSTLEIFDKSLKDPNPLPSWIWFSSLEAASMADAKLLLPATLYHCAGTPTIENIQEAQICTSNSTVGNEECFFSNLRDRILCLKAREAMTMQASKMIYKIGMQEMSAKSCETRSQCREKRLKWAKEMIELPGFLHLPLNADLSGRLLGLTLCKACLKTMTSLVREGRQEFWDEMPKMFGLGRSWDDLLKGSEGD